MRFDPKDAKFAPERLQIDRPAYPSAANELGFEGRCSMLFELDQDGSAKSFQILEESFPGMFAKSCREAASSIRYKPLAGDAMGRTESVAQFNINFAIDQKVAACSSRETGFDCNTPPGMMALSSTCMFWRSLPTPD